MLTIFWFRRDLRVDDNVGFFQALEENENVLPIFIFDKNILDKLDDPQDKRVNFIYQTLLELQEKFKAHHSSLLIQHTTPLEAFQNIIQKFEVKNVYTNHDYEPYAKERDIQVKNFLNENDIAFKTYKDQAIFEKKEVLTDAGKVYTVFSPYGKKWRKQLKEEHTEHHPSEENLNKLFKTEPFTIPSLEEMGFQKIDFDFPKKETDNKLLQAYGDMRNFPAINGTSRLSVHVRFGTISIRNLVKIAQKTSDAWLNELIWRDFYMMILDNFPHVVNGGFRPAYDVIPWRNNEVEFKAWCEGKTGYPIVDAGMRELNETGFMHNRVRMITASFLTKHLLIDWRWGEAYFAKKLLDFDLSANNGGWQWASSSGCDAAPYFRVFNPTLQTKNFDKELKYVKKWVPELNSLNYPQPIVEHKFARERALKVYKEALYG